MKANGKIIQCFNDKKEFQDYLYDNMRDIYNNPEYYSFGYYVENILDDFEKDGDIYADFCQSIGLEAQYQSSWDKDATEPSGYYYPDLTEEQEQEYFEYLYDDSKRLSEIADYVLDHATEGDCGIILDKWGAIYILQDKLQIL